MLLSLFYKALLKTCSQDAAEDKARKLMIFGKELEHAVMTEEIIVDMVKALLQTFLDKNTVKQKSEWRILLEDKDNIIGSSIFSKQTTEAVRRVSS